MKHNNRFSKFLVALAALALLITVFAGLTIVSAEEVNLFDDGSFESIGANGYKDWASGWDLYWFPPECADDYDQAKKDTYIPNDPTGAHSGNYYLMNDRTGWFGIAEPSVELAAGSYEFSAWVNAVEGTLKVNLTVDQNDVPVVETDQIGTSVEIPEGTGWRQIKMKFTITTAGTYRVRLGMNSIGQEVVEYRFDDFALVATGAVDAAEVGKITVSEAQAGGNEGGGDNANTGGMTIEMTAATDTISNAELATPTGLELNKAYLTIFVKDADGNELSLKDIYRAEGITLESSDPNVAIIKGNYKSYYVYGVSVGEATVTMKINYNGMSASASVSVKVEGSILKDGGFETSYGWHENDHWTVITGRDATGMHWGYDVNSTFNMTGGNNMFIRMPNGDDQVHTDGTVLVYQDVYLTPASYSFAAYIRRFPGFEQQDTVDGYDSYNTPVTVGAILLDANGNETDIKYAETYKDDYKMGVGDFEACAVQFSVAEAGTYRLYLYAESEIHVGMGMQVDNMCLVSGQQIDHVEVSFGTNNTVKVNTAEPLVFKAYYADGTEVDLGDVRPTYLSSNTAVLSVTSDNKVFGLAPGTANLTVAVTVNGVEYKCTIEATVEGDEVSPTPSEPGANPSAPGDADGGNDTTIIIVAAAVAVVIIIVIAVCVVAKKKKNEK